MCFQMEILNVQEQAIPMSLKNKLMGKTSLGAQRNLTGTQTKKENVSLLEEETGHSGGLQGSCELCREKTVRPKPS